MYTVVLRTIALWGTGGRRLLLRLPFCFVHGGVCSVVFVLIAFGAFYLLLSYEHLDEGEFRTV